MVNVTSFSGVTYVLRQTAPRTNSCDISAQETGNRDITHSALWMLNFSTLCTIPRQSIYFSQSYTHLCKQSYPAMEHNSTIYMPEIKRRVVIEVFFSSAAFTSTTANYNINACACLCTKNCFGILCQHCMLFFKQMMLQYK